MYAAAGGHASVLRQILMLAANAPEAESRKRFHPMRPVGGPGDANPARATQYSS